MEYRYDAFERTHRHFGIQIKGVTMKHISDRFVKPLDLKCAPVRGVTPRIIETL